MICRMNITHLHRDASVFACMYPRVIAFIYCGVCVNVSAYLCLCIVVFISICLYRSVCVFISVYVSLHISVCVRVGRMRRGDVYHYQTGQTVTRRPPRRKAAVETGAAATSAEAQRVTAGAAAAIGALITTTTRPPREAAAARRLNPPPARRRIPPAGAARKRAAAGVAVARPRRREIQCLCRRGRERGEATRETNRTAVREGGEEVEEEVGARRRGDRSTLTNLRPRRLPLSTGGSSGEGSSCSSSWED
jgi:hypothetical protein